jgi:hypothetical protein
LVLLGFTWILSSEMSLFNGLCAAPRDFICRAGALPPKEEIGLHAGGVTRVSL